MKTKNILLFLILLISLELTAQKTPIENRWNLKFAYRNVTTPFIANNEQLQAPGLQLTVNYGINKYIETGMIAGYAQNITKISYNKFNAKYCLANVNFQILPLFINATDFRINVYVNGRLGINFSESSLSKSNAFIYGAGLGLILYPFNHIGVFADYNLGKYYMDYSKFRIGLSFKF